MFGFDRTKHLFLILLIAGGCAFYHPDYPRAWPSLVTGPVAIENSIEGVFDCRGDAVSKYAGPLKTNLSYFLFDSDVEAEQCDTVEIRHSMPDTLELLAIKDNAIIPRKQLYRSHDYVVRGGWIYLKTKRGLSYGQNVVGMYHSSRQCLTSDLANDLIIKSEGWGLGVILLLPAGASGYNWVKFKKLTNVK